MRRYPNEIHFQFLGMKLSAIGVIPVLVSAVVILFFLSIWAFK